MPDIPHHDDPEEAAFWRLEGPWEALDPAGVARLLAGVEAPWWIAGGWAIEAFAGQPRPHEDVDVAFWRKDVRTFRNGLWPAYHAWAVGTGLRSPLGEDDDLPEWADQVWVREHAWAPWLMDMVMTRDLDGAWVYKRDESVTMPLEDATWLAGDGIRYLRPEIALGHKARLHRPKDDHDFGVTVPLLDEAAHAWLRQAVAKEDPGHPWLDRLADTGNSRH